MTLGWIYALRDRGIERGIKIGRDRNRLERYHIAQCYTPRGIDVVGLWAVGAGGRHPTLAAAERQARAGLRPVHGLCVGEEWCDIDAAGALAHATERLGIEPVTAAPDLKPRATYDDFRNPKHVDQHPARQLLWVFQENGTGILKVQRNNMWMTNLDRPRTYSVLGFRLVACFGFGTAEHYGDLNRRTDQLWRAIVTELGNGVEAPQVGWLAPEVTLPQVSAMIEASGMSRIDLAAGKPAGLKAHDYHH